MTHLVDSDWLIDAIGGVPSAVRMLDRLSPRGLAVSIIAVGEIYEGAFGLPNSEVILESSANSWTITRPYPSPIRLLSGLLVYAPPFGAKVNESRTWIC
ncbi:MAG: hypothetical protein H0T18_05305 [Chloroflexia bacterium]|nr:hypothetical protein [Chloroflexia bacterium]